MGQGTGSKTTRRKGTPVNNGTSAVSHGGDGPPEEPPPADLTFRLVRVDPRIASGVRVGDGVGLQAAGSTWQVLVQQGRLGDVPPRYAQKVTDSGARTGSVTKIQGGAVWVTVG